MCENHLRSARGEGDVPLRVLGSDAGGDLLARALQGIPKVKDILWFCAKKNPKKAKKKAQIPRKRPRPRSFYVKHFFPR